MNIFDFKLKKQKDEKITMVTCYDAWTAKIINETNIDAVLVGDSLAMVMHGYDSTLAATVEMMELHTQAVRKTLTKPFLVSDMPFLSYRKDLTTTMNAVEKLMRAGAQAVKLEGCSGHENFIKHIVESGVPVMGHLGLTPQSTHQLGGYKVQGKDATSAQYLMAEAEKLQSLGCFSLVLECVPTSLAKKITESLSIPTIGIGAGPFVDGQILVLQDLLGVDPDMKPRFLRNYADLNNVIKKALEQYQLDTAEGLFPNEKESYV